MCQCTDLDIKVLLLSNELYNIIFDVVFKLSNLGL